MSISQFTNQLKELESKLNYYCDPSNTDGFLPLFVDWVIEKWETLEYYDIEYIDQGYDCSSHPKRTGKKLSENIQYYWEFINAANGSREATFCSGSGFRADTTESDFGVFFSDTMSNVFDKEIEKMSIALPQEFSNECEDVNEFIYGQYACHVKYPKLCDICDDIVLKYGCFGWNRDPYICEMMFDLDDTKQSDHRFAMMTLQDFEELKQCLLA